MRLLTAKELVHERLGDKFEHALSNYDTQRRLDVLVSEFLGPVDLSGKRVLDVGTGLGFFAQALQDRGAKVIAVDIGESLLARVRERVGCECLKVDVLALVDEFGPECFDVVLSSECIEHTPSPEQAIRQMARVLRPGGYLSLSTPNLVWLPVVRVATICGLRPFDGLEHFSTFKTLRTTLREEHVQVVREKGLHLIPFQLPMRPFSRWLDDHAQLLRRAMINLCVLGRKKE
jgi:2-polyprenyl-3-methyl-5-hydroxy-6-metoxy-1,4-benzoquinol methylase